MREDRSFLSDIMGDSKMENNINNKTSSDFSPDNFVPFAVTEEEKAWLSEYREKHNAVFSSGKPVTEEGLETIKELTSQNTYVFLYAKYKKAQKTIKVKASVAAFFALFATLIGTSIIEVIFPVRGFIYAGLSCAAIVSATSSAYASVKRKMYDKIFSQVPKREELTNTPKVQAEEVLPPIAEQPAPKNTPFIATQEEEMQVCKEESKPCSETPSTASQSVEAKQKDDLHTPFSLRPFAETKREKAALQMYEEAYQKAFHSEDVEEIKNAFDRLEYIVSTNEFSSMRTKAEKANTSNSVKSKQKKIIVALSIVCAVFLISTVALSIATYTENQKAKDLQATVKELKDENFELQKDIIHKDGEIDDLTSKYNRACLKANFLDEHIAFVTNPYADYYHTYSCPTFQNADSYWAYNIEAAEANGYSPCPRCH